MVPIPDIRLARIVRFVLVVQPLGGQEILALIADLDTVGQ